jgi:hypothetical protein
MTTPNTKPIVCSTHALISVEDGVQYFAVPEDYVTFPKQVMWVALGDKVKCWIEVFSVGSDDSEGINDFSEDLEVTVNIDSSFFPPSTPNWAIVNWRWFTLLTDS